MCGENKLPRLRDLHGNLKTNAVESYPDESKRTFFHATGAGFHMATRCLNFERLENFKLTVCLDLIYKNAKY